MRKQPSQQQFRKKGFKKAKKKIFLNNFLDLENGLKHLAVFFVGGEEKNVCEYVTSNNKRNKRKEKGKKINVSLHFSPTKAENFVS